jgi:hypothetical protein
MAYVLENLEHKIDIESAETVFVENAMRIPETQLKAVGYVCEVTHRDGDKIYGDPYATGFFASVPCMTVGLTEMEMYYFITARHVANDLKDREICFTFNRKGGGTIHIEHMIPGWFVHPTDKNADVAVIQIAVNPHLYDIAPIQVKHFGLPERLKELNIGIGDEVHSIGLFSAVPGDEDKNIPIIRYGNISMMATEVQTELGFTQMYLVEARSIGGMSGSPVFVRPTYGHQQARRNGPPATYFTPGTGETLLGIAHGHWAIREEEINKSSFTHDNKRGVNYGIALVVPAIKIYETLYQPMLVSVRERLERDAMQKRKTIPSSDSPKEKPDKAFTQSDFEDALKKASRKITPYKN